jgi:uncharacterized protein
MTAETPKPNRPWWLRGIRLFIIVLVMYLIVLVIALCFENTLVYLPQGAESWSPKPHDRVEDITIPTTDAGPIHAWWFPPNDPNNQNVLLYCHGKGGNLSHRGRHIIEMQSRLDGPGVLIFDYPGFGKSTGRLSEANSYAGTHAAYDWLVQEKKIDTSNIILLGESLGGGVAAELAVTKPCRKLVMCCTFTRLPVAAAHKFWWLPCDLLMRNRFNSLDRIRKFQGELLIVHGTADDTIPFWQGKQLFDDATTPTKQLIQLDGARHCDYLYESFLNELKK